jgi:CTP:molybdopterin cytidylyltransferase MocA
MGILPDTGVVLPCAGAGLRVGAARPKQFLDLGGRPVFHRSLTAFLAHPRIAAVVLVVAPSELHQVRADLARFYGSMISSGRLSLTEGGDERWVSVRNGVHALPGSVRLFAVHDVARPFLTAQDIDSVLAAAQLDGASTMAVSCPDTVKRAVEEVDPGLRFRGHRSNDPAPGGKHLGSAPDLADPDSPGLPPRNPGGLLLASGGTGRGRHRPTRPAWPNPSGTPSDWSEARIACARSPPPRIWSGPGGCWSGTWAEASPPEFAEGK